MGEVAAALAIPLILLVFMLDDIIKAWHDGKAKVEEQKTLGELAKDRQEASKTRQEELKLERAKLARDKQLS